MATSFSKVLILLFTLALTAIEAKDLGVWGMLFPIAEQDFRELIYQRLNEMKQNGEMAKLNEKFVNNVKRHTLRPTPVAGLITTKNPQTYYYDPTYTLTRNIEDHEGRIIAKKGTVINPLDIVTLHGVLFFFNADDAKQIDWALAQGKKHGYVKYILVIGNIQAAGKKLNERIYFDQHGSLTKQLGIKHIPCPVKQEGKRLQIQEFALTK